MSNTDPPTVRTRLPLIIRGWRYWCRSGPRRADGSIIAGSFLHRILLSLDSSTKRRLFDRARVEICCANATTILFLDALDLHTYQRVLPELVSDQNEIRLARCLVDEKSLFLDVGANIGALSMMALLGNAMRVVSFEPNPDIASLLVRSRHASGMQQRWTIAAVGLGSKPGREILYTDRLFSGTSSLHRFWQGTNGRRCEIALETLDDWMAGQANAPEPDQTIIIKMDVEGWEAEVISGARSTIQEFAPYLWFELNQPALNTLSDTRGLPTSLAHQLGYRFAIDIDALPEIQTVDLAMPERSGERRINLLAIPESRRNDFTQRVLPAFGVAGAD